MKKIDPEGKKIPLGLWLSGAALVLIFLILGAYIIKLTINQVRAARQSYYQQIASLKKQDVEVTIIEGWRREQIAALLAKNNIVDQEEFLAVTENLEGKLFPDTYRFFPNSKAEDVVKKFTDNFQEKTKDLGTISQDNLILASIIEREAGSNSERAKIAGVYLNRIRDGMMLEADPTVQYARDNNELSKVNLIKFTFWQPITKDDTVLIDSNYNTYRVKGWPPAPIANPGLSSISAAVNPDHHPFYYFFHAEDSQIVFSRTLADHNYNKSVYGVR